MHKSYSPVVIRLYLFFYNYYFSYKENYLNRREKYPGPMSYYAKDDMIKFHFPSYSFNKQPKVQ